MKMTKRSLLGLSIAAALVAALVMRFDLLATSGNIYEQIQRMAEALQVVDKLYVEEVDVGKLVDGGIRGMLEELDPHSVYISSERLQEITERFEGEFEGIGIEFIVHEKYPLIISPIPDSPSEEVGLRSGDRIVEIEGKSTYGITEDEVREELLGSKGTAVTIKVARGGVDEPFEVTIIRDKIPVRSITTAFMLDGRTGYIRVGRFARTTGKELSAALLELDGQGMQQLLLDLRGNSGGYLDQAVEMVDFFLKGEKRIVYTRGRIASANEDYYSSDNAEYAGLPLVVLINHGSASASEIVAGAVQDWDRGLVVGETSFGKGLVQTQVSLRDGSALRVTTARYYTPSGRLIQRPYDNGLDEYVTGGYDSYDPNLDTTDTEDKPVFTTQSGRKVYGGGGISPDVIVASPRLTPATIALVQERIFFDFGQMVAPRYREWEDDFSRFASEFKVGAQLMDEFWQFARNRNAYEDELTRDRDFIKRRIKSELARRLWSTEKFRQVEVYGDAQVAEAMQQFPLAGKLIGAAVDGRR